MSHRFDLPVPLASRFVKQHLEPGVAGAYPFGRAKAAWSSQRLLVMEEAGEPGVCRFMGVASKVLAREIPGFDLRQAKFTVNTGTPVGMRCCLYVVRVTEPCLVILHLHDDANADRWTYTIEKTANVVQMDKPEVSEQPLVNQRFLDL